MDVCRFAPSTTGPAHPGTLLAALLCWLDARSRGARLLLRLEDLDPERCRPQWSAAMQRDLGWLGLDWDEVTEQHDFTTRHDAALDRLAEAGRLYACACSRARIRAHGERATDGGWRYPGWCRERGLPPGGWRACREPLRVRLPEDRVELRDESGRELSQHPAAELGDPVVRRRDGAMAYLLATVVDDGASGVTRVVRGHDLAATTATQLLLQRLLGLPQPTYRHHLLLLEERNEEQSNRMRYEEQRAEPGASRAGERSSANRKLAKFHGAIGMDELHGGYDAEALCGVLAHAAGLQAEPAPTTPATLLRDFSWERVTAQDRLLRILREGETARLALA
jgi:glutamyl/glutaminyl-tRNA synthetase